MYFLEKNFKNLILSYVKKEEKSISGLAKELESEGHKMHRLYLAGYLKALTDLGILKEKNIPPSKVYTTSVHLDKTLYESIGEKCRDLKISEDRKATAAAFILQRLFKRPVFLSEIRMCGFEGVVVSSKATPEERTDIRNYLLKSGLAIPGNDPAYKVEDRFMNEFEVVVTNALLEKFDATSLIVDTRQAKIEDVPGVENVKSAKLGARTRTKNK